MPARRGLIRFRCSGDPSADQLAAYAKLATVGREDFMRALPGERNRRGKRWGMGFRLMPPHGREKISGEEDLLRTVLVDSEVPSRQDGGAEGHSRLP